jgi:alkylation response protein AidB-like acyl-CoA dehydrogenase
VLCCWRTVPDAPKRKGISYFLLDMTTPGIEVRPSVTPSADSHFCEIFLNDVSIPSANLVGTGERGMASGAGDPGRGAA